MASFETAWAVTSSWEGPWKPFKKRDVPNDKGDYLPHGRFGEKNYTGTSWGLTAEFMQDYRVLPDSTILKVMPLMPKGDAATHWRETRWVWCRGAEIIDQSIATLIFDYFAQSNIDAMKDIGNVILGFYKKPNINYTFSDIMEWDKHKNIKPGARHRNPEGGFLKITPLGVQLINNAQTQDVLFNAIKAARIKRKGNITRIKAFNYGNILTQSEYEVKLEKSGKNRLMTRSANSPTASREKDFVALEWGLVAFGVYKGYQYVRSRYKGNLKMD